MATTDIEKCLKCQKVVYEDQNSLSCDECNKWIHLKCSRLKRKEFKLFTTNSELIFTCDFCKYYRCGKCQKHVYDHQNSICCDNCDVWTHLKCTNLTLKEYNKHKIGFEKSWFCIPCKNEIFPFSKLDNKKFQSVFPPVDKIEKMVKLSLQKKNHKYSNVCTVCQKKIIKTHKGIPCKTCYHIIHRKCSCIPSTDLTHEILAHWECLNCIANKFPFSHIDSDELLQEISFNSNFDCNCKKTKPFAKNSTKQRLNLSLGTSDKASDNFPNTNNVDQHFDMKLSFDYYNIHDFHKLSKKINDKNSLSLLHTNICSLKGNFENLDLLITDLDFKFDIIALTETWNSNEKKHLFQAGNLAGYQQYLGITGTTIKSGCGFYISNQLKYIPRKDLDITFYNDQNEFQCKWIEIINNKKSNTVIGVFYRHPKKTSDNTFNEKLKVLLKKIKHENKLFIIAGDFNYNLLKFENDNHINEFVNNMLGNYFQPCILEPTRYTDHSKPSLVDNIFINSVDKKTTSGNIIDKITDHLPNFIILENIINKNSKQKIKIRNYKKFDEASYLQDLQSFAVTTNTMDFSGYNIKKY